MSSPRPWSLLDTYAAYIASIEGGERLLGLVNDLFAAADSDGFRRALSTILAELGHEVAPVEESARLTSREVLQRVTCLVRYGRFAVSLVELKYPQRYPSNLAPVFRLHPNGIVFTYSADFKSSSVVFSAPSSGGGTRLLQRVLVGRGAGLDLRDTLLVWLWRLSGLRPRYEDDARTLAARASEWLRCAPDQIDARWGEVRTSTSAPKPGPGWVESLGWSQRGFFEAGSAGWVFGLERVLRDAFPFHFPDRRWRLEYRRFEVVGAPIVHPTALALEGHRLQQIRLHLALEDDASGRSEEIPVECDLPVADDAGRFLLDGVWARFAPRVDAHGAVLRDSRNRSNDDHEEDQADEDEQGRRAPSTYYGASLGVFLELAVARKLGGIRLSLRRGSDDSLPPRARLRRALRRASGPLGRPLLCSLAFLRERLLRLAPPALAVPSLVAADDPPEVPPAWCCPEVARELPRRVLVPVVGAVLTPAGGLALPEAAEEGQVLWRARTGSALEINPRWGGPAAGPLSWWIADGLEAHARWRGGTLPSPRALALADEGQALFVVRRGGASLRGWISREAVEPRLPAPLTVTMMSTAMAGEAQLPELTVAAGARVRPGIVWLEGPPLTRRKGDPHSRDMERLFKAFVANGETEHRLGIREKERRGQSPGDRVSEDLVDAHYWHGVVERRRRTRATRRVPPGIDGVVLEARIDRIEERGEVLGWRATLVVQPAPVRALPAALVLPGGPVVRDLDWLEPAEAPIPADGVRWPEVDVVVEIPGFEGATPCIVGDEREVTPQARASGAEEVAWIIPGAPPRVDGPDWESGRRMRDGEWLPSTPAGPGVAAKDRWWWALRDPATYAAIAARECAWAGGTPPWWTRLQAALASAGLGLPRADAPAAPSRAPTDAETAIDFWQPKPKSAIPVLQISHKLHRQIEPVVLDAGWACECGAIRSPAHAHEICRVCGTAVCHRESPATAARGPGFPDQTVILHPWAKPAVAGMLGLTESELEAWLDARPWSLAVEAIESAIEAPLDLAAARLAAGRRSLPPLGEPLALLQMLMGGPLPPPLFLKVSEISLLPAVLAPLWEVGGAPLPVHGPLARGYSVLEFALRRLALLSEWREAVPPWIVEVQRREVQRAADQLFGRGAGGASRGEPRTLADLIGRLLPWTRPPGLRSNPPGSIRLTGLVPIDAEAPARSALHVERIVLRPPLLARINVNDADDGDPSAVERWPELADPSTVRTIAMDLAVRGDAPTRTAVLLDDRAVVMPERPAIAGSWRKVDTWQRRAALEWALGEGAGLLAALALEIDDGVAGLHALSTVLAHLCAASDARPLRALFQGPQGSGLADGEEDSIEVLVGVMTALAPGDAPAIVAARSWFARALAAWWKVPVSVVEPTGWRYIRDGAAPSGGRRGIPPASSTAWTQLGGWLLLHRPCLWFLQDRSRLDLSRWPGAIRILIGVDPWLAHLEIDAPRALDDPAPAVEGALLEDEGTDAAPSPGSEPALELLPVAPEVPASLSPSAVTTPDIVAFRGTLLDWLQRRPV